MIKAIIFDIGGVLLEMDKLALPVAEVFQPEDAEKFWQELNEKFSPLCRGEGTLLGFWKSLAKDYNKEIPDSILRQLWINDFEKNLIINKEVKELVLSLKKGYKLAIISNIINEHADILKGNREFSELYSLFDIVVFSNEVKMAKDRKEIFAHTIEKLKVRPEECIFTDDTKKFVEVANSLGINAVQFKNAENFKEYLRNFGVRI